MRPAEKIAKRGIRVMAKFEDDVIRPCEFEKASYEIDEDGNLFVEHEKGETIFAVDKWYRVDIAKPAFTRANTLEGGSGVIHEQ